MAPAIRLLPFLLLGLAACEPGATGGSPGIRVGGSAAIGLGSDGAMANRHGGSGPPPGRTPAEREARHKYYQGPRGEEF
ncbi:MAG: hypothetical protein KDK02_01375 [Rhodobacteraceae bacterium]|nr:hypothetical protein [Paracoccaceae bacterium]